MPSPRLRYVGELLVRIPLGIGKVFAQLVCRTAWAVTRGIALYTPSLFEWSCVHCVEAELVQKSGDYDFGFSVVTGNGQRATILRASRLPMSGQLCGVDMVEGLDNL